MAIGSPFVEVCCNQYSTGFGRFCISLQSHIYCKPTTVFLYTSLDVLDSRRFVQYNDHISKRQAMEPAQSWYQTAQAFVFLLIDIICHSGTTASHLGRRLILTGCFPWWTPFLFVSGSDRWPFSVVVHGKGFDCPAPPNLFFNIMYERTDFYD